MNEILQFVMGVVGAFLIGLGTGYRSGYKDAEQDSGGVKVYRP